MPDRRTLPYGSWPSPISIEMAVAGNLALREPRLDGDDVYWTEGRPGEGGRQVIVRWNATDGTVDVTPVGYNARTMAHEYGGGAYAVDEGEVFFSNLADSRVYRHHAGQPPVALTDAGPFRYGDLVVDRPRNRLLCVREDHSRIEGGQQVPAGGRVPEPEDALIAVDLSNGKASVLARGRDFYSTPRPSGDGRRLAWLSWGHPNMPWDSTDLWLAEVDDVGQPLAPRMIAGGSEESVVQPEWAPDGTLVFASDRSGWWNLYRFIPGADGDGEFRALAPMEAEFSGPQWVFGMSWFGTGLDGTIVAMARRNGSDQLWMIPVGAEPERIAVSDTFIGSVQVAGARVCYVGAGPAEPPGLVLIDLASGTRRVVRRSFELTVDPDYISAPRPITFPTTDGDVAHAIYYAPVNRDAVGPPDERPPLVVMTHGGPTAMSPAVLDLTKQVFTSRGFGVVDVNYRGSNGYGRAYMRRLDGKWGIYDVDDAIAAARHLAARGEVDPDRMAIRGGSAGGYTTLCALTFHDVFAAGASHYGVGDLEALARDTHKFESRYLDRLVAPYPGGLELYRERSPIYFTDRLSRPLVVFQGADDMVVARAQADKLVDALRERRIPHAYICFEGEGHGFRQAANIRRALEAELSFYAQVFGFALADAIEPVEVEFLRR